MTTMPYRKLLGLAVWERISSFGRHIAPNRFVVITLFSRSCGARPVAGALLVFFSWAAGAEILSSDRRIDWDPGVRGGIPARTTVYRTLGPASTASQIQSTLNSCPSNQVVQLDAGTFTINSTLTIPSGVTLRGAGISNTILRGAGGFSGSYFIRFYNNFDYNYSQPARTLVSPTKGAANITTTAAHGWSVGDFLLVDMLQQPNGDPPVDSQGSLGTAGWVSRDNGTHPMGQRCRVLSVPTSTTATIDPPLYFSYPNTCQAIRLTGLTHYAGVENLTIDNLTSSVRDTFYVAGAINCWIARIQSIGHYRRFMWGSDALWFTMHGCHVVGGIPVGVDKTGAYISDRSYGVFLGAMSASLFENNIFEKLTIGLTWEGPGSGNVSSYNFFTNIWWTDTGDAPRRFGMSMHGPHPFMNLIEGNWSGGRLRADEYWGTSSHFTALRNRVVQIDRGSGDSQTWTVDVERRNWYWSFIGNVLGGGGGVNENNYELINGESAPYSDSRSTIWKIGYNSLGTGSSLYDQGTLQTMVRWGNWCYRTNDNVVGSGITWHTDNVQDTNDTVIPKSYYLTDAPRWWPSSLKWPPYDPYNPSANSLTNIPAGYRYVFGVDPPDSGAAAPAPPTGLRVVSN